MTWWRLSSALADAWLTMFQALAWAGSRLSSRCCSESRMMEDKVPVTVSWVRLASSFSRLEYGGLSPSLVQLPFPRAEHGQNRPVPGDKREHQQIAQVQGGADGGERPYRRPTPVQPVGQEGEDEHDDRQ